MAWTQDDLDVLERAFASGELEVQSHDGRRVRYRSVEELQTQISTVRSALAAQAAGRGAGGGGIYRFRPVTVRGD